jgi:hypothetical protein
MYKYRPIFATLIALLFYTITDILIWQRVFEANNLTHFAGTYHTGWFVTLAGYGLLGALLMWGFWKDILFFLTSLFVLAFSGLEDVLYYLLDGKPMPEGLPWLDPNPMIFEVSRLGVISSVLFWVGAVTVLYFLMYLWRRPALAVETAEAIATP